MPKTPDRRTTIRLKPDEYALLMAKASNQPLSTFLRELVLEKATQCRQATKPAPIKDHIGLAQVLGLLGQHDLVQAFKRADREIADGVRPADYETKLLLQECRELLASVHKLLMRALGVAER